MKTALRANRATRDLVKTTGIKRPESQQNLDVFWRFLKKLHFLEKWNQKSCPKTKGSLFFLIGQDSDGLILMPIS